MLYPFLEWLKFQGRYEGRLVHRWFRLELEQTWAQTRRPASQARTTKARPYCEPGLLKSFNQGFVKEGLGGLQISKFHSWLGLEKAGPVLARVSHRWRNCFVRVSRPPVEPLHHRRRPQLRREHQPH